MFLGGGGGWGVSGGGGGGEFKCTSRCLYIGGRKFLEPLIEFSGSQSIVIITMLLPYCVYLHII